jgi:hypothetical protein
MKTTTPNGVTNGMFLLHNYSEPTVISKRTIENDKQTTVQHQASMVESIIEAIVEPIIFKC